MNRENPPESDAVHVPETPAEASEFLGRTEPFSTLSAENLEMLASRAEWRRVARGATIYEEGDRASMLAVLRAGSVVLVREPLGHAIVRLARLGPGAVVGGGEVWTADPRQATARAVSDSVLLCLMREDLAELERRAPDSALRLQLAAARQSSTNLQGVLDAEEDRVRYRLELEVEGREESGSHRFWLVDISPGGLRLDGAPEAWVPGHRLEFTLGTPVGDLPVAGRVAWREGSHCGIALDEPWEEARDEIRLQTLIATVRSGAAPPEP